MNKANFKETTTTSKKLVLFFEMTPSSLGVGEEA